MPIQVVGHGFEITEALRTHCIEESRDKLQPLALQNFTSKWILSLERGEYIAHLAWDDGGFHGDITVRSDDMYGSIRQCAKKAVEQMKRSHERRLETRKNPKPEAASRLVVIGEGEEEFGT